MLPDLLPDSGLTALIVLVLPLPLALALAVASIRLFREYKRGTVYQLDDMLAERERRARFIDAEGELQAAEKLFQAAQILAQEPQAILLRYLETLTVIGADKNTTVVFPLPMDLIGPLLGKARA
jgi:hypothetical protein